MDGTWLCSWCKQKKDGQSGDRPCLLCPKQGGALKLAQKTENQGLQVEYAHLFCCQWMPEVYVENIRTMEPIMNIDGINDTQRKLVCYLCKVKFGACVRCSYGMYCCLLIVHSIDYWMVQQTEGYIYIYIYVYIYIFFLSGKGCRVS